MEIGIDSFAAILPDLATARRAVTVLSAADLVRVSQDVATIDLIARGRAELVKGSIELVGTEVAPIVRAANVRR